MTPTDKTTGPGAITLAALFVKFLRFGMLAFGGPVAQIAMLRDTLVDRERWIDGARFNRLLAVMQALPGPEAHELAVHMGMIARGRIGGLLAGLGFMLPGFVLMLAGAWAYTSWLAGMGALEGVLLAVQIAVLAIILRAVVRIGEHMLVSVALAFIALAALGATMWGIPFWIPLLAGGIAYGVTDRGWQTMVIVAAILGAAMVAGDWLPTPMSAGAGISHADGAASPSALFIAGLKGGLLTFGGAYTAIPYVRADTVGRGWISDAQFLDGIALAGVLPAPLVIFATFAGYVAGGPAGALAITAGMFLPAFAFSMIFFERLEALVDHPALARFLAGVGAAAVGIIAATFIDLAMATQIRVSQPLVALALFAAALAFVWRFRSLWAVPATLLGAAAAGALVPV